MAKQVGSEGQNVSVRWVESSTDMSKEGWLVYMDFGCHTGGKFNLRFVLSFSLTILP
jgi:hypothetical protein